MATTRTPLDPRITMGATVVLEGIGLGRVTAIDERHVDVAMDDGSRRGVFGSFDRLRLPIAAELAPATIDRLQQPPPSPLSGDDRLARIGEFTRTEPKTWTLCVDELVRLYGTSPPLSFSERGLVTRLERAVVGELAFATQCALQDLVQRVRPAALAAQLGDV